MADSRQLTASVVSVSPSALPWTCPPPSKTKWNSHPRVFIPLNAKQPKQQCPYCGTRYALATADNNTRK